MKSGEGTTRRRRSHGATLGKRDRAILDDVIRYRLITNEWVLSRYLAGAKPNAAVKITGRLSRDGWLEGHSLIRRKRYFTPGPRLAKQRGLPLARTRPFGTQSLAMHLSVLRYCTLPSGGGPGGRQFKVAIEEELSQAFPWAPPFSLRRLSVLDGEPKRETWRMLRIDLGGRPDHVVRKIAADLARLMEHAEFTRLLTDGRFVLVILTASRHKKQLIEQSLSDRPWPPGMRFQTGVIPELFDLIATF